MIGSTELVLQKSHLYANGVTAKDPMTGRLVWSGPRREAARWARLNRRRLMDYTREPYNWNDQ